MGKPVTSQGEIITHLHQPIAFQSLNLTLRSKCVLCDADIEKEIPNGSTNNFSLPYVCDNCKFIWKEFINSRKG